eukprot:gene12036-2622_t
MTVGNENAGQSFVGFKIIFTTAKKLNIDVITETVHYNGTYDIAQNGWLHFAVTWSKSSGIRLYEDGVLVVNGSFVEAVAFLNSASKIHIGANTANRGTQLHDLKLWSFWLSANDVMNIFSPGKGDYSQKAEDMTKFRPGTCLGAMAAYGRKVSVYELYHVEGSFPLKCIPVENGVKYYIFPDLPVYNVTGPWKSNFEATIKYEQNSKTIIRHLINSASSCEQKVSFTCMMTGISDSDLYGWNNELLVGSCVGGTCNCVASASVVQKDIKQYNVTKKLPLTKIIRKSISLSNHYQMFDIGPVECFQDMRVYSSCKHALEVNSFAAGKYTISTSVKNIFVHCSKNDSNFVTRIDHELSGLSIRVHGYEEHGSYVRLIRYLEDFESILAVINVADSCKQEVTAECYNSLLPDYSWFDDRDGNKINYQCKCGTENNCPTTGPTRSCNCQNNDNVIRNDIIVYSQKSQLPLTTLRAGDTGNPPEYITFEVGSLECISAVAAGVNSCHRETSGKSCYESKISNFGNCENEMDFNGCCEFPFTYRNRTYNNCTTTDSVVPWCSLTPEYSGQWRYCISSQPKADIDFSLGAKETTGDWKIGYTCSEDDNSGPCYDMTFSSTPSEKSQEKPAVHRLSYKSVSSLDKINGFCTQKFIGSVNYTTTAISYSATDLTRPEFLDSVSFCLSSNADSPVEAIVHIYAAVSLDEADSVYISKCKYQFFRSAMYFGPVIWKYGPVSDGKYIGGPDLKKIVLPILSSSDPNVSQKRIYLLLEWQEFLIGNGITDSLHNPCKELYLRHKVRGPGNYLQADKSDTKRQGEALVYDAKFFSPSKKCIRFWYFMSAVGNSMLMVNLYQEYHTAKEIIRIVGDQGTKWKKATIPIEALVDSQGNLAKVSFVAMYGSNSSRSIAIDDISILSESCILQPNQLHEYGVLGHLPKAAIFIPLDHSLYDNNSASVMFSPSSPPGPKTADNFGYPHQHAYFNGVQNRLHVTYQDQIELSNDFTICLNTKPASLSSTLNLLQTSDGSLVLRMIEGGTLTLW